MRHGEFHVALAASGHTVTGVDPADASVAAARARPGGERVTWVKGTSAVRFRTEAELRASLTSAGFVVDRVYGGWRQEPVGHGDGEFVVLARAGTVAPVF
ncbi:hypothetical protein ACWEOS_25590 [Micromonospora taraxaci]